MTTTSRPRLENKTAVVVGAGQTPGETVGNGRAVAMLFAREGAHVVVVDRHEASAEETKAFIAGEGGRADVVVADIASSGAPAAVVERSLELLGRIDILHNNVGIGAGDSTPASLKEDAWDRILDVNLKAMWLTCKAALPSMREQRGGAIVNISSLAAVAAAGNLTAYKISKAGVNALTQNLALTNARYGIRANALMPGFIDTPMAVDAPARATGTDRGEYAALRAGRVPLGHQGTAWDVAYAALYLASDEAAFVTGVVLPVDGGQGAMTG
ncbi:MAG TPA: SDR family NAD(P)-dependent oxidoreductase [Acidimicrobiales bacterium]|jgi:NAD(P)-dependent dehydrogenase (short-subunit alcohol dehydrogenase family)|nr:SDR family NAD(P)-dependent oxidoreductase [Acidimicrobiales bacterium]